MADNSSYVYLWALQYHNPSSRTQSRRGANEPHGTSPLDTVPRGILRNTSSASLTNRCTDDASDVSPPGATNARSISPFDSASWAFLHQTSAAVSNKCASAANGITFAYEPLAASALSGPMGKLPEVDLRQSVEDGEDKLQIVKPPSPGFDFSSWSLATNAWMRQKALDVLFPHDRVVYKDVSASLNSKYESVF